MKFDCRCGWPGFWTNVQGAVCEEVDPDGQRREILCTRCCGHLGHLYRKEDHGFSTDERHCVNSSCLVFLPAEGGSPVFPKYDSFLRSPSGSCV
ncbi:unnamed protein product [Polarella glacialis]|uniref:MsrB domain-containing protein n=2 Tax=Polarella glacialis TaxID=89957 RepID=A0A813FAT7_POLGL|nr:unnamed protein product [Polarella glacialis]